MNQNLEQFLLNGSPRRGSGFGRIAMSASLGTEDDYSRPSRETCSEKPQDRTRTVDSVLY